MERYAAGGGLSLRLDNSLDGSSIAHATVNLPGVRLPGNELLIKDYSENEGVLEALELAGLIVDSTLCVQAGEKVLHRVWITPLLDSQWSQFRQEQSAHAQPER